MIWRPCGIEGWHDGHAQIVAPEMRLREIDAKVPHPPLTSDI
jgi:hypothetical protein